jgi:acetyl-CoA synthetase
VPKAYVVLAAGWAPDAGTAEDILRYARERLAPFQRIRRLEFADLPKTISGKIRRVELRAQENDRHGPAAAAGQAGAGQAGAGQDTGGRTRAEAEFWEEDFPGLRAAVPDKNE